MRDPKRLGPFGRSGVTLLEVVAVVIIISILLALLLPAVVVTRDRGPRRTQCSIHLSNLVKAAIMHELKSKQYPGWIQSYGWFSGGSSDPVPADTDVGDFVFHQKLGSWTVALLPYLDAQPTYEVWTDDRHPLVLGLGYTENAAPNLTILQCPTSHTLVGPRGRNSYISNNGMHHLLAGGVIPAPLWNEGDELAALARSMRAANGVFNSKFTGRNMPMGVAVSFDDLKDGLGNTVLFSESLQAHPWHQVRLHEHASVELLTSATRAAEGEPPRSPEQDVDYPSDEARFLQGFVWHWEDDDRAVQQTTGCPPVNPMHRINGKFAVGSRVLGAPESSADDRSLADLPHLARPSSAHAGGVNMSFADGASRYVTDSIDYRVYQALMTPHGKQSDVPVPEFVLTGTDID